MERNQSLEVQREEQPERTFWRFQRKPIAGGGEFLRLQRLAEFKNGTETTVPLDWSILYREASQVVVVARNRELSARALESIAPNLFNWSTEDDLPLLLDQCPAENEGKAETKYLDRLGRRKRIPVKDYLDNLMAVRLGYSVETIRSYRERGLRDRRR